MSESNPCPRALIAEDRPPQAATMKKILETAGFAVTLAAKYVLAETLARDESFDAYVLDLSFPDAPDGASGITLLDLALKAAPLAPFAVVSAHLGDTLGTQLASYRFQQDSPVRRLISKDTVFETPLEEWARIAFEFASVRISSLMGSPFSARDPRVRKIRAELVPVIAATEMPVLVLGETGTGKEIIAREIHEHECNPWREGRFIGVNCAAASDQLILSDLFGHVLGAFTGAYDNRLGWFLEASGWKHEHASAASPRSELLAELLGHLGVSSRDDLLDGVVGPGDVQAQRKAINQWVRSVTGAIKRASGAREYISWLEKSGNEIVYVKRAVKGDKVVDTLMGIPYREEERDAAEYLYVRNATAGTLFLDEIGDLSSPAEASLLRALDGYGIRPVGYTGPALLPNCRVIAATNRIRSRRDLRRHVDEGSYRKGMREDLFHRVAGWVVSLPPLRSRFDERRQPEWVGELERRAAEHGLCFDDNVLEQFASDMAAREGARLWEGNWREFGWLYKRLRASAEARPGNKTITRADLEFASQWVLVEERGDTQGFARVDGVSSHDLDEITERLDEILELKRQFPDQGITTEMHAEARGVTRSAMSTYWKGHAPAVVSIVKARLSLYRPIVPHLRRYKSLNAALADVDPDATDA